jgi:hypothetical protein
MARYRYPRDGNGFSKDQNGRILTSTTVVCYLTSTTTPAKIYAASAGGVAIYSVTSSATDGSFSFWIDDSDYASTQFFDITFTKTNYKTVTSSAVSIIAGQAIAVPGTTVTGDVVLWNDTVGGTLSDSGIKVTTDGTLAANSNVLLPTEQAVKTYADTKASGTFASAAEILAGAVSTKPIAPDQLAINFASPRAIGETLPNTIRGNNVEVYKTQSADSPLTAAQVGGTIISNYGMTDADCAIALPAAAQGYSFVCILPAVRARYFKLQANGADIIYLAGTAGAGGGYVGVASGYSTGSSASFFTFKNSAGGYSWFCLPLFGSWVAS